MARYVIRAVKGGGPVEFDERLTIEAALTRVKQLRDAHFEHITLINILTGVQIEDLGSLIPNGDARPA